MVSERLPWWRRLLCLMQIHHFQASETEYGLWECRHCGVGTHVPADKWG